MSRSIYLINPRSDFPTYFGAEAFAGWGLSPTILIADLAVATVAGLVPVDFHVRVCDESHSQVDFDSDVDFVAITGKITQVGRMRAIAEEFRRRGRTVLIGGPFASLSPDVVRPFCDILVRGEIESVAAELFSDLREGAWREEYVGERPELSLCTMPRWDLYPNSAALMGSVQTSRGCPFECEFCDVIQYLGRRQRHKTPTQILAELDRVYEAGYRDVFLADDNLTVYRSRAKEMMEALRWWNMRRPAGRVRFFSQVSIDAARDEELLRLCADAGLTGVFIGIETPNEDSLRETKKRQNLKVNLTEQVERFLAAGIAVTGGMIVGFDSDGLDIFDRQRQFAAATPIPIFTLGALVAPAATPLHARMASEGRLREDGTEVIGTPWNTNIEPRQMSRDELLSGVKQLCRDIYAPGAFASRVLAFIDRLGPRRDPRASEIVQPEWRREVDRRGVELLERLIGLGPQELNAWRQIRARLVSRPDAREFVTPMLIQYTQVRYMYQQGQFWDAHGAEPSAEPFIPFGSLRK